MGRMKFSPEFRLRADLWTGFHIELSPTVLVSDTGLLRTDCGRAWLLVGAFDKITRSMPARRAQERFGDARSWGGVVN